MKREGVGWGSWREDKFAVPSSIPHKNKATIHTFEKTRRRTIVGRWDHHRRSLMFVFLFVSSINVSSLLYGLPKHSPFVYYGKSLNSERRDLSSQRYRDEVAIRTILFNFHARRPCIFFVGGAGTRQSRFHAPRCTFAPSTSSSLRALPRPQSRR